MKSILWLCKTRIHCKININLTVANCATEEYNFRGLGDSLFCASSITQYRALNFLILQSGFLFHLKTMLLERHCDQQLTSLKNISHVSLLIRLWILSFIALKYSSMFHLIRSLFTSDYQDRGFETWKHKIISYETLMMYQYNFLHPTQPLTIGSHPYLYCYHKPIMNHICLNCNIIYILLYSAQRKNCCRIFLIPLQTTHMGSIPTW